jgi:hypothetical protein
MLGGGVQVYDPLISRDPIWRGDLEPDAVHEFDVSYQLPQDHCGDWINQAWAIGHPVDGSPEVRDDDEWIVSVICGPEPEPSIDVEKLLAFDGTSWVDADEIDGQPEIEIGAGVDFRFVLTNTGNITLYDITLGDSVFDVSSCGLPIAELAPGDVFQCDIGPFLATAGQHTNTATALVVYDGTTYSDADDANYFGYDPFTPTLLTIFPEVMHVVAGQKIAFFVLAQDENGQEYDVTDRTTFTISSGAGGSWAGNVYTSEVLGLWTVTASFGDLEAQSHLRTGRTILFFPFISKGSFVPTVLGP